MKFRHFLFWWGPVIFWCGVIFGFSSIPMLPKVEIIWWDFIIKKTAHVGEYAILYFLLWRAIKKGWIIPLVLGLIYALSDEYHQSFVPGRTATLRDAGFDLSGMLIMLYALKNKWNIFQTAPAKPKK